VFFRSLERSWRVLVYEISFKCISICHKMGFLFFILYDRFKIVLPGSLWLVAFSELFSLIKCFSLAQIKTSLAVLFSGFYIAKFWISIKNRQISWLGSCI
jgi:hypothetical protein